jgi:hypothetical protein
MSYFAEYLLDTRHTFTPYIVNSQPGIVDSLS